MIIGFLAEQSNSYLTGRNDVNDIFCYCMPWIVHFIQNKIMSNIKETLIC